MGASQESSRDLSGHRYRVLGTLGEGGTSTVRLAIAQGPSSFNKLVVLKMLKRELAEEAEFRRMFLQEARLAARLSHPNIVQTNEVYEHDGVPVIVMEYLEGQALSQVLARASGRTFTRAMHLRVIMAALDGLHYAHELRDFDGSELGLVHRDVSPHNLFITFDGQVKILDFGLAKLSASHMETRPGVVRGKIRYISPEQLLAEGVDRRADIYSVGVMLWEAATGEKLWRGKTEPEIMAHVFAGELPLPSSIAPEVPRELEQVIMKALARDKAERYASAAELEAALEPALEAFGTIHSRDIGKTVSVLFNDVRIQTKAAIKSQLSTVSSLSAAEYEATQTPAVLLAPSPESTGSLTARETGTMSTVAGLAGTLPPPKTSRRVFWVVAAGMVAVAVAVFVRTARDGSLAAERPEVPAKTVALPAAKPELVKLRLSASPIEAQIYFDNEKVSTNPFVKEMPRDGTRHIVRAEAEGYLPAGAAVILDKDSDVVLLLERQAEPEPKETPRPQAAPPPRWRERTKPAEPSPAPTQSAPTQSASPARSSQCDPPYFVDSRGIKKFRPECM